MIDNTQVSDEAGCLALPFATALAALLITIGSFPPPWLGTYILVLVFTAIMAGAIGMPLYSMARHFRLANVWTAIAAGAATGVAGPLLIVFSDNSRQAWFTTGGYGLTGAVSGLAIYLTATAPQAPRRNIVLVAMLAGTSVAAAVLVGPPAL